MAHDIFYRMTTARLYVMFMQEVGFEIVISICVIDWILFS